MTEEKVIEEQARILSNTQAFEKLYTIVLESPRIANCLQPGQFVHMEIPGMPHKILRRPFSVYKTNTEAGTLEILYQVVGGGTEVLASVEAGTHASLIGPVGNTWAPPEHGKALLVGGGVGAAPLFLLAKHLSDAGAEFGVVLGAQTKDAMVAYGDYCALPGAEVVPATDDGSFGYSGFCTQPAQDAISSGAYNYVAVCGPAPLMNIVAHSALDAHIPCEVSLERRMACGVGACLSCVVDTTEGKKRCCVDGPIFAADKVVW